MNKMISKEKVINCLDFRKGSKSVKAEFGFWYETIIRWNKEGLPLDDGSMLKSDGHNIKGNFNSGSAEHDTVDKAVHRYFNFDFNSYSIKNSFSPKYDTKTVEEDNNFVIFVDDYGITQKVIKNEENDIKTTMPMYLDYPIKSREDFFSYKERFNEDFDKRMEPGWEKKYKEKKDKDYLIWLCGTSNGLFWFPRKVMGLERFLMNIYDDPYLIKEMLDFILEYTISFWEYILDKVEVDIVLMREDFAYKGGGFISPYLFKEIFLPRYKKLTDFLKSYRIKNIFIDSDGDINSLIPLIIESGINGILPLEMTGEMDIVKIRKMFPNLKMAGGINKMMISGDMNEIDKELEKVPFVLKKGGYIPFLDHTVPPVIPWGNFKYYREKLNKIIDNNSVG
jgi:uroporphyrinogen decarboxylase